MTKKMGRIVCIFLFITFVSSGAHQSPPPASSLKQVATPAEMGKPELDIDYGKIPLYFIPNKGQVEKTALFYADTSRYTLWITLEGLIFDSIAGRFEREVSRVKFLHANPHVRVESEAMADYKVSYFRGKNRSDWHTGIKTSQAVLYKALYQNIDLRVYGVEQEIEYDFIVKPGGEVEDISFKYQSTQSARLGAKGTILGEAGDLIINTRFGELRHTHPTAYQEIGRERVEVKAAFKKIAEDTYGFKIGDYDKNRELIIDPLVLVYSTYIGGKGGEGTTYLDVDSTGAAYLATWVYSKKFPTKNPIYPDFGGEIDTSITKVSADGSSLVYSTFLGGTDRDLPGGVAVDSTGAAYVIGVARAGFPTVNSLQEKKGIADAFVVKVHPSGTSLIYSTLLGGSDFDRARGIFPDSNGNAYVTGLTRSMDFPKKKAFQKKYGGNGDAFITKINPTGSALIFSTYLGGSGMEEGLELVLDTKMNIYVTGDTASQDFPRKKAFQKKLAGENDGFLSKFNPKAKKLIYSTYLGGTKTEQARSLDVDIWGNAYVIGSTDSPDFPVVKALFATHSGDFDIFITKFKPNGKKVRFSTYLGGPQVDNGQAIIVDADNTVYIRGYTESKKFPTKNAYIKKYQGAGDSVLAQFTDDGQGLIFSTFFGGSDIDRGLGFALDYMGGIYIAGGTSSSDFPLKKPLQKRYKGEGDMYLTKFIKE